MKLIASKDFKFVLSYRWHNSLFHIDMQVLAGCHSYMWSSSVWSHQNTSHYLIPRFTFQFRYKDWTPEVFTLAVGHVMNMINHLSSKHSPPQPPVENDREKTYFHAIPCPCCTCGMIIGSTFAALNAGSMNLLTYYAFLQPSKRHIQQSRSTIQQCC